MYARVPGRGDGSAKNHGSVPLDRVRRRAVRRDGRRFGAERQCRRALDSQMLPTRLRAATHGRLGRRYAALLAIEQRVEAVDLLGRQEGVQLEHAVALEHPGGQAAGVRRADGTAHLRALQEGESVHPARGRRSGAGRWRQQLPRRPLLRRFERGAGMRAAKSCRQSRGRDDATARAAMLRRERDFLRTRVSKRPLIGAELRLSEYSRIPERATVRTINPGAISRLTYLFHPTFGYGVYVYINVDTSALTRELASDTSSRSNSKDFAKGVKTRAKRIFARSD